jgi:hypothetical protein
MDTATQSAAITAFAAVAGSIVGGLASFMTTFFTQRNQAHRDLLSREVAHREELYAQFIKEATNLYADSLDKPLTNPTALIGMYSLIGRIRLVGSDKVLAAAEKVGDSIIVSYSRPRQHLTTFTRWFAIAALIRSRSSPRRAEKSEKLRSCIYSCGDSFEHGMS